MAPSSQVQGNVRYGFMTILFILSIVGLYYMRIHPAQTGIPIDFEESIAQGRLSRRLGDGPPITIRKQYTGIEVIDQGLQFLVVAFISGPAAVEDRIWYQQFHFLAGFAPTLGILTIESCRKRWRNCRGVKYTSIWAVFYQTVGGAFVVPLYPLYFIFRSKPSATKGPTGTHLTHGQEIDEATSGALIPSMMLGYIIPTALLYAYPVHDLYTKMGLVAFWQVTPFVVNFLLVTLSLAFSTFIAPTAQPQDSIAHLHHYYAILTGFAAFAHLYVLAVILRSSSPSENFSSVFVPNFSDALLSTSAGLHSLFQWDWILIATSQLVWALYTVIELRSANVANINLIVAIFLLSLGVVLMGPGGALACVWWWREVVLFRSANKELKAE